tara:strand:+ start:6224 stop:6433 length:210 start_codon:yes stop_codon:yes gene_type:complete
MDNVLTKEKMIKVYELDTNYSTFKCNLDDFISENDGLTSDEIDELNTLEINGKMYMGVHCGFIGIRRIQ